MSIILAVFTVTGAVWWCGAALLVAFLAVARRSARRDEVRQATQVVAQAEALLRKSAGG